MANPCNVVCTVWIRLFLFCRFSMNFGYYGAACWFFLSLTWLTNNAIPKCTYRRSLFPPLRFSEDIHISHFRHAFFLCLLVRIAFTAHIAAGIWGVRYCQFTFSHFILDIALFAERSHGVFWGFVLPFPYQHISTLQCEWKTEAGFTNFYAFSSLRLFF